ncbi:MAG: hypothetical protein ACYDCP_02400 [Thermoplasmataceae archaeon]|jgi:putative transposase|nr:hypothetical protein [Candidatus Thermoplasmatota archaeon]
MEIRHKVCPDSYGKSRNTYLLEIITCYKRVVVDHYIWCHCQGNDIKEIIMTAFYRMKPEKISGIRMRIDNETQFICNTVENFLSMMNIPHERTHLKTPKEYTHKESFNSILRR